MSTYTALTLDKFHIRRGIIFRYGTQSKRCMKQNQPRMKLVGQIIFFISSSIFTFFLDISTHESKGAKVLMTVAIGRTQ